MFFSLHTFEQKAGKSIQDFNGQWGWIRCFFLDATYLNIRL